MFLPSFSGLPNKWYQSCGSAWWGVGVDHGIGSIIRCQNSHLV
ncbi:hypothetical protein A2U01_0118399, partial [Trifolium medium]|nr:hypothetical protein [Trifolium medium]